jgi:hypothetical protein
MPGRLFSFEPFIGCSESCPLTKSKTAGTNGSALRILIMPLLRKLLSNGLKDIIILSTYNYKRTITINIKCLI